MSDSLDDVLENSGEPGVPELRTTLHELIDGHDTVARVVDLRRLKRHVYRLRVEANGGVRSLVLKRLAPDVAHRNQLLVEHWLPTLGLSEIGPGLLGVAAERTGGWVWHVYDDLGDCMLDARAVDRVAVTAATERIALLHTRSATHPVLARCRLYGNDLGMPYYTANMRDGIRALESLQPSVVALSPERIALRDRLLARLYQRLDEQPCRTQAMEELGGPEVLLHGDLWAANIFVCQGEGGPRVRLIDWDHVGVGPITYDLSTLLSRFPLRDRHWILQCYCSSIGWRLPSVTDLNLLCATADWARWASCLIEPALAALEGDHVDWAFDTLASIEQWCDMMTLAVPEVEPQ